jgi:hypothetical protein
VNAPDAHVEVPPNANSGRRAYFLALLRSRSVVYPLVLGAICPFLLGAYIRAPQLMVLAPATVATSVLAIAAFVADRRAKINFFSAFAARSGLEYVERWDIPAFTPLLGAGTDRWCEHWMMGQVVREPALSGGLGYFVYERRSESEGSAGRVGHTTEHTSLTICAVDIEPSLPLFKGVYLRPHRSFFELKRDWLAGARTRKVELESIAFAQKYELRIADDQDELLLRQLLSPSLVEWLAQHPLAPGFELRAGMLVVFLPRALDDAGNLTFLLDTAGEIARRVVAEVREASGSLAYAMLRQNGEDRRDIGGGRAPARRERGHSAALGSRRQAQDF